VGEDSDARQEGGEDGGDIKMLRWEPQEDIWLRLGSALRRRLKYCAAGCVAAPSLLPCWKLQGTTPAEWICW